MAISTRRTQSEMNAAQKREWKRIARATMTKEERQLALDMMRARYGSPADIAHKLGKKEEAILGVFWLNAYRTWDLHKETK